MNATDATPPLDTIPQAQVVKKTAPSLVWLIPLIAGIIGLWLIYKTVSEQGPEITITFKSAAGLEAGKTKIKFKDVEIGRVNKIHLSKDYSHVLVTARIDQHAEDFLKRQTRFWVVRPRLTLQGVSGLGTLMSGAYIEIEPGAGATMATFKGLEVPPVVRADELGQKYILMARRLGSIDTGSPLYYQGILAGEVLGYELGNDQKSVFIHVFVKAPYHQLVRGNTRFWNVSGVDVSIGADGVDIRTESIQTLMLGGIAFETPDSLEPSQASEDGLIFTLYDKYSDIKETTYTKKIYFVLFFEGSVRGLKVGAPVEFKGIRLGSVTDIKMEVNRNDMTFRIPVLIEIEPERIGERGKQRGSSPYEMLQKLVERGLRARLETGNYLTGQLFVDLDFHPGSPKHLAGDSAQYPELPTIPNSLDEFATSVTQFFAKLQELPLDKIALELQESLHGVNKTVNDPQILETMGFMKTSMQSLENLLTQLNQDVGPLATGVIDITKTANTTLEHLDKTLIMANEVIKPDAPLHYGLVQMIEELTETARSVRTLVEYLEHNPEALFFGKGGNKQQ